LVASWELRRFGPATKVTTRRSIAAKPYDRQLKQRMQAALAHEPVTFSGEQAREIVCGFANTPYAVHACVVLPEHVHLVIAHTQRSIRTVVGHLKAEATRALRARGWFASHSPWADHGWNVFLNSDADVDRAVKYVENNPLREGKRQQCWRFVVPFNPATARGRST
jgi:REP element-mobilizing transposase RayT